MKYWSYSRSRLLKSCPRAYFFRYLLRNSDEARRARVLGNLSTLQMAAGGAVDFVISRTLAAWRGKGELKTDLDEVGERLIRRIIAESPHTVDAMRNCDQDAPKYDRHLPPLASDFYNIDLGADFTERMVTRVMQCLHSFEHGEIWERIRGYGCSTWAPIVHVDLERMPFFMVNRCIRVSAAYDFAVKVDSTIHIIDWKAGIRSERAQRDACDQLHVYGLWAASEYRAPIETVRAQAVWLSEGAPVWNPQPLIPGLATETENRIQQEVADDQMRMISVCDPDSNVVSYEVDPTAYPPSPSTKRCLECPFRELCPAGQSECAHVANPRTSQKTPHILLTQASS